MPRRCRHLVALTALALAGCSTVASVDPGHGAVLTAEDGTRAVIGEGEVEVPGLAVLDDFDLRQQDQGGTFQAMTSDGVPVTVGDPVVTFSIVPGELQALDAQLGPDHWRDVVVPVVHSTIASVLGTYRWDGLTTDHLREAQARITQLAAARLRPMHIALASVDLKGVTARLPGFAQAVSDTSVWEQRSAQARAEVDVAKQRAESLRTEAAGIAAANARVAPTLTPGVLESKSNQAWAALLVSPRAQVDVTSDPQPVMEVSP